jgi:hypothetical protein
VPSVDLLIGVGKEPNNMLKLRLTTRLFRTEEEEKLEFLSDQQEEQLWHVQQQINHLTDLVKDNDLLAVYFQRIADHCDRRYQERIEEETLKDKKIEAENKIIYQD